MELSHIPRDARNRTATPRLDVLDIEVVHRDGVLKTDPNNILALYRYGDIGDPKPLAGLRSIISGAAGVLYRTDDIEIPLTPAELERMVHRALAPDEVERLLMHYGVHYEWHGDFYCLETGEARQPLGHFSHE